MACQALVDLRPDCLGDIVRIETASHIWGKAEKRPGGKFLVVEITGSISAVQARRFLIKHEKRVAVEGDSEFDPENPGVEMVNVHKWAWLLKLDQLPDEAKEQIGTGVISITAAQFRNNCMNKLRRRSFDPAKADGEGNQVEDPTTPLSEVVL